MMKIAVSLVLGLALALGSAQAFRVLEVLERSYELRLTDVSLPRSDAEAIGYKPCTRCAYSYMHISGETTYHLGSRRVSLAELTEEAARIKRTAGASDRTLVMLHYDPQTGIATRIRMESPKG
ncbi:MAG TPA: hypothetical protein VKQ06_06285 [Gammaproteobacteria bacterium]|nr:hypothetical protein [Gammaproteobacteria bacterium]